MGNWQIPAEFLGRDQIGYGWLMGKAWRPLDRIIDSACIARQSP
jgi:hypothetical protein